MKIKALNYLEKFLMIILVADLCFLSFLGIKNLTKSYNNHKYQEEISKQKHLEMEKIENEISHIDPVFKDYVKDFIADAHSRKINTEIKNFTIVFGNTRIFNPRHIGYCMMDEKKILIDRKHWNNAPVESRQQLIDHELGHCLLGRAHVEGLYKNNLPQSVMHPNLIPGIYSKHKSHYRNELFYEPTFGSLKKMQIAQRKQKK